MLHIVDCDGVLVDSETLVCRIESELLRRVGLGPSPEEIAASFVGLSDAEMHRRIEEEWEIRLPSLLEAVWSRLSVGDRPRRGAPRRLRQRGRQRRR